MSSPDQGGQTAATYTRRRILVATTVLAVPAMLYSQTKGRSGPPAAPSSLATSHPPAVLDSASGLASTDAAMAATTVPIATSIPTVVAVFDHDVQPGTSGEKVGLVQDRLRELGFDPGPTDSVFGPATQRAVWAYEKFILGVAVGDVTGVVTPTMWARMNDTHEIRPRRADPGTHLEILLDQQVAALYVGDTVRLITHISSGTGEQWCAVVLVDRDDGTQIEDGICGIAVTPGGVFHFERRFAGWRNSKLGRLYNPVYFNYGLAVHGASNVPKYPASHGCVRIPMHIAEYFPSLVSDGDLVYVFDGVQQPETYGAQVPIFDYPDPNYVDVTTSTVAVSTTTTHVDTTSSSSLTVATGSSAVGG